MNTDEFKGNSHKSKTTPAEDKNKKVKKVISGKAIAKKKTGFSKLKDSLISDDFSNIKSYILMDVLLPGIKKGISDIVTTGIQMLLYGDKGRGSTAGRVSYRSYYDRGGTNYSDAYKSSTRSRTVGHDLDDIVVESRGEAEEVLVRLDELISHYGQASVADFYDLVGVTGSYTDNNWGWTDLRTAVVRPVRQGYVFKMPKISPLR